MIYCDNWRRKVYDNIVLFYFYSIVTNTRRLLIVRESKLINDSSFKISDIYLYYLSIF